MKKLIFIDDEVLHCKYYLSNLRSSFEVIYCDNATDGLNAINNNPDVALVVLDIMMPIPAGVELSEVLRSYKDVGLWIVDQIRPVLVQRMLPVVVLTNRAPDTFQSFIDAVNRDVRAKSGRSRDQIAAWTKVQCPAAQIVQTVSAMLGRFS